MTAIAQPLPVDAAPAALPVDRATTVARTRLLAIDALRGLVMLFMLVDHVRETWFLWMPVSDPVDATTTDPALFFTRLLSTFCAPTFVALTGLSAWLYGQSHTKREVSEFLIKRGLFLIALEVTVVGFAWATMPLVFPPATFFLQVMWAIGISMIALAALLHLPRPAQFALGLVIVCLHNLLDPIRLAPGDSGYALWAMIHQRAPLEVGGFVVKVTYPVLPWIGVILLGYACGPWFAKGSDPLLRMKRLVTLGLSLIIGFVVIRYLNFYGDKPWFVVEGNPLRSVMSFLALTKYPPSLLFLMPTIGAGALMLAALEAREDSRAVPFLAAIGGAPMFYYILHLYVLKTLYNIALAIYGPTHGTLFGVDHVWVVWVWVAILIPVLYFPTRWFAQLKARRRDIWWLKYL